MAEQRITFDCSNCGFAVHSPLRGAGRSSPCPKCGSSCQVPYPGKSDLRLRCGVDGTEHDLDHNGPCNSCDETDSLYRYCVIHKTSVDEGPCSQCVHDAQEDFHKERAGRYRLRSANVDTVTPEPVEVSAPFIPLAESSQAQFQGEPSKFGKVHPIAIVSLVLGILSWTLGCCCYLYIPLGLAAAITGGFGIHFANQGRGGKGMAIAGLVLGVLALIGLTILLIIGYATLPALQN